MKSFMWKFLLAAALLTGPACTVANGDITEFVLPAKYCFPQTFIRSEFGRFDSVILDHNIIIDEENHFKHGDLYVAFRRKSQPDVLWFTDGTSWYSTADEDIPKAYPTILPHGDGRLQPVMPIMLSHTPIDVSAFVGDGEIWVGYGVKAEGEPWHESFRDMLENQRYELIWDIIGPTPFSGLRGVHPVICLTATEMKKIVLVARTAGSDEVAVDD